MGPLGVGTLVVKPKRPVIRVSDPTFKEAREHGPLLRLSAAVVDFAPAGACGVCRRRKGGRGPET